MPEDTPAETMEQPLPTDMQHAGKRQRPAWSAAESAKRCGVARSTIQRALTQGRFPNAMSTDEGWRIPVEDLLAAGFHPGRSTPPTEQVADTSTDTQVLQAELVALHAEVERLHARAAAAERLLDERERVISVQTEALAATQLALRAIESASAREPRPAEVLDLRTLEPAAGTPRRRWWGGRRTNEYRA